MNKDIRSYNIPFEIVFCMGVSNSTWPGWSRCLETDKEWSRIRSRCLRSKPVTVKMQDTYGELL